MSHFLNNFKFNYQLVKRVIKVAPRKSKQVKKLYINYALSPANSSSEIIIKYHFRNALWYTVNGIKTFDTSFTLPVNTPKEVSLTVQGLSEKCTYTLLLKPEHIDILKITHTK